MLNKKRNLQEVDEDFHLDLKEVQRERISLGKDNPMKPKGVKRLTKGIHNHPLFRNILLDLKRAELPKKSNKKGNLMGMTAIMVGLILFIVLSVVIVFISALWVNFFGDVTDTLVGIPATSNISNISKYADITFGNLNIAFQQLRWISVVIIFGMLMGILISNFLIKIHPAFFIFYIFIIIMMVFVSIFISNSFETIYTGGGVLGDSLQQFKAGSWIILYLPMWITIISVVGGILLFVNMKRDDSQGEIV